MAFKALDTETTVEYISPNDPDPTDPTVWHLGMLDSFQMSEIQNLMGGLDGTGAALGDFQMQIVRYGLRGVDNFGGAEFKTQKVNSRGGRSVSVVRDSFLRQVPNAVISELSARLIDMNMLSEDEQKN